MLLDDNAQEVLGAGASEQGIGLSTCLHEMAQREAGRWRNMCSPHRRYRDHGLVRCVAPGSEQDAARHRGEMPAIRPSATPSPLTPAPQSSTAASPSAWTARRGAARPDRLSGPGPYRNPDRWTPRSQDRWSVWRHDGMEEARKLPFPLYLPLTEGLPCVSPRTDGKMAQNPGKPSKDFRLLRCGKMMRDKPPRGATGQTSRERIEFFSIKARTSANSVRRAATSSATFLASSCISAFSAFI